jgi:hypothetical protein
VRSCTLAHLVGGTKPRATIGIEHAACLCRKWNSATLFGSSEDSVDDRVLKMIDSSRNGVWLAELCSVQLGTSSALCCVSTFRSNRTCRLVVITNLKQLRVTKLWSDYTRFHTKERLKRTQVILIWNEISKLSVLMFVSTMNFFDILKVVSRAIWGQQCHTKVWNYSHYGHRQQPDTYNPTDVSIGCFDLCAVGLGQSRSVNIEHLKSFQAQWTWSLCFVCTMLRSLQHSYSKLVSCSWCLCLL